MSIHLIRTVVSSIAVAGLTLSVGLASAKHLPSSNERRPVVSSAKQAAPQFACTAPAQFVRLDYSLNRVAQKLLAGQPLTIVAIGSSSTFGEGASSPEMSYPSRLTGELQAMFPASPITVLNRGVNGETTDDMLARFDTDVFATHPDLVIWQVGSNSVLQGRPVGPAANLIREGLDRLKADGTDVIVLNPQYAPEIVNNGAEPMVDMIGQTVREGHVNLFHRFALMRHWQQKEHMPFSSFLAKDELHMNDWSYGCVAKLMATAINDTVTRPRLAALGRPRS